MCAIPSISLDRNCTMADNLNVTFPDQWMVVMSTQLVRAQYVEDMVPSDRHDLDWLLDWRYRPPFPCPTPVYE